MSKICKYTLVILIIQYYVLVTICQTVVSKHSFPSNKTNNSTEQFQKIDKDLNNQALIENSITLDHYFFSYDVIDHNTLLIKFDITRTILFQKTKILYDAYLYISKLPATNYKIDIGPFSGYYEKEIDGTITDHFTLCLVLLPHQYQKKSNNTLNQYNKTKTIFHKYLRSSYQKQQQHILHYCTKMGPDEDGHRHHKKQGSEGDHILLILQVMMIGIFLAILQIAHIIKNRKYQEWRLRQLHRFHHEVSSRKEYSGLSNDALEMLRFTSINNEESQQEEEEEEHEEIEQKKEVDEDSLILSHRRLPIPIIKRTRTRPSSPNSGVANNNTDDSSIDHILESKPWLQISQ